ncbi:MAG: response regulator [gamma proteobacterium symbiont of Bathyaustriella thionipta]|nr:response regulator [gamma proteobacterium symbiont of Bathyaustriella thionipta]
MRNTPAEAQSCILMVDDNAANLGILSATLNNPQRRILAATSGAEALSIVREVLPDLILLDIVMPGMSGFDVIRELKSNPGTADVPVIFLSALSHPDDVVDGLRAGALDYIVKPFNAEEVEARVTNHLRLRKLELQREKQNARLELLNDRVLQTMREAVMGLDSEGRIVFANQAAVELLRAGDADALIGVYCDSLLDSKEPIDHMLKQTGQPAVHHFEAQTRGDNGEPLPLECSVAAVQGKADAQGSVLVVRDISERVKAANALRSAHDKVLQSHRALQQAQEKLIQAARMESVGQLAAGVAHETKNPLAIIQLGVEYLLDNEPHNETDQQVLEDIAEAVRRADTVVKGLMDFARESRIEAQAVDINRLIETSLSLIRHEARSRDIKVHSRLADKLPKFMADKDKISQVLVNLLMNATQSIGKNGEIDIITCYEKASRELLLDVPDKLHLSDRPLLQIIIQDNGGGIAEHDLRRLFDPFFTTKPVGEGTGLGLSVSRNIVQMHGGWLLLRNRSQKQGAEAILLFPVEENQAT